MKRFLNDKTNKNKKFIPYGHKMPHIFVADWISGKYEPTKQGRIHLHLLVKFLNFQLIQKCYQAENFDAAVGNIHELLEWININITSYVNYFGDELEKEIASFRLYKDPEAD